MDFTVDDLFSAIEEHLNEMSRWERAKLTLTLAFLAIVCMIAVCLEGRSPFGRA